jgi:hypothetical protein
MVNCRLTSGGRRQAVAVLVRLKSRLEQRRRCEMLDVDGSIGGPSGDDRGLSLSTRFDGRFLGERSALF